MSLEIQAAITTVLSATIAGVILLLAWRPWSKRFHAEPRTARRRAGWAAPLALGVAFALAFWREAGLPDVPPHSAWEWLLPLILFAGVVGVIVELVGERQDVTFAGCAIVAIAAGWMLRLPDHDAWFHRMGIAAVIAVALWALLPVAARRLGPVVPLVFSLTFFAAAPLFNAAAFNTITVLTTAMGASAFAMFIVAALARKSFTLGPGGLIVLVAMLHALLLTSTAYDSFDVPGLPYALLALAPGGLWLAAIPVIDRRRPWIRATAAVVFPVLVIASAILTLQLHLSAEEASESGEDDYPVIDYESL